MTSREAPFNARAGALLLVSFLSGVAALNYELLWVREFTLVAGSTQAAISAVLSVYFLGLALGSYAAGRLTRTSIPPLVLYVAVELTIGIWAVLSRPLFDGLGGFYAATYMKLASQSPLVHLLRISSAAGLLLVPACCMGATLPLLAHLGARDPAHAPRWSAVMYGANTIGAMTGTFLTGFILVEHLGVSRSLLLTGLLNLACALSVLPWIRSRAHGAAKSVALSEAEPGRHAQSSPEIRGPSTPGVSRPTSPDARLRRLLLASFGILGFANIALEVLWTRYFALIYPNDTYVFSAILMIFLLGVGAGSLVGQSVLSRIRRPLFALGVLQIISAGMSLGLLFFAPAIAVGLMARSQGFSAQLLAYFIGVGIATIIPTFCMGATFPLLVRATITHPDETGEVVGRALSWNTIGGVLGAALGGYLFLDHLGLAAGLYISAALTALVGLALCAAQPEMRRYAAVPLVVFGLPLLVAFIGLPPRLPDDLFAMHFPTVPPVRILETRSSVHGTVAITEEQGIRRVWINSAWVASDQAHLSFGYAPWILHPGPVRSALGICCGTGRTFGALMNAGIPNLDLVDINAAVIALSGKWLAQSNHGVLTDPRAHIVVDDGRNFVRYSNRKYDLITLEPLQMFQKGVVYFYTEEFYRQARARMDPGGILCQWVPLYLLDEQQFRSVVRTFLKAFPNSILWGRRGHSVVLLGYNSDDPVPRFDPQEIYARVGAPQVQADLAHEEMTGKFDPIVYTLMAGDGLSALGASGEIYSDDRPTLEFTSPRTHYTPDENLALVLDNLTPLSDLFPLNDAGLAGKLEELRRLTLQISFTNADREGLMRRIRDIRGQIYPEEAQADGRKDDRPSRRPFESEQ